MEPLLGLVHSQKWSFILDAAAYLTVIARTLNAAGPILNVGCHAGYLTLWLARAVGVDIKGVDASKPAIRLAREKGKALNLCPVPATFDSMQFPKQRPSGQFNMVCSVDGGVDLESKALVAAATLLAEDGVLVWIGDGGGLDAGQLRETLASAKLSLLIADVVGGWDGVTFSANMVLVMTQGADPDVPADFKEQSKWLWDIRGFREYCNTSGRASDQKTLGTFRTQISYRTSNGTGR